MRFGIRLHVVVRESTNEAWRAADELIGYVTDDTIAVAQEMFSHFDSTGQRRMIELHNGQRSNLEVSPNLWAGVGLVRSGAGTALVGDPETIRAGSGSIGNWELRHLFCLVILISKKLIAWRSCFSPGFLCRIARTHHCARLADVNSLKKVCVPGRERWSRRETVGPPIGLWQFRTP